MSDRDTIVSLCDLTGVMVRPWAEAGYRTIQVDPQLETSGEGRSIRLGGKVGDEWIDSLLVDVCMSGRVAFLAAFPPCTDLAVSGARWFKSKLEADPDCQKRAVELAQKCAWFGELAGCPWFVENPVSVLSSMWRKPDHYFHPYQFTALEEGDNYTKKNMPLDRWWIQDARGNETPRPRTG